MQRLHLPQFLFELKSGAAIGIRCPGRPESSRKLPERHDGVVDELIRPALGERRHFLWRGCRAADGGQRGNGPYAGFRGELRQLFQLRIVVHLIQRDLAFPDSCRVVRKPRVKARVELRAFPERGGADADQVFRGLHARPECVRGGHGIRNVAGERDVVRPAPEEEEETVFVAFEQVAGVEPAVLEPACREFRQVQVAGHHARGTDEKRPVFVEAHLHMPSRVTHRGWRTLEPVRVRAEQAAAGLCGAVGVQHPRVRHRWRPVIPACPGQFPRLCPRVSWRLVSRQACSGVSSSGTRAEGSASRRDQLAVVVEDVDVGHRDGTPGAA